MLLLLIVQELMLKTILIFLSYTESSLVILLREIFSNFYKAVLSLMFKPLCFLYC